MLVFFILNYADKFIARHYESIIIRTIGLMSRVFANGPGDRGSIPGRVIPKTQKWYLIPLSIIT